MNGQMVSGTGNGGQGYAQGLRPRVYENLNGRRKPPAVGFMVQAWQDTGRRIVSGKSGRILCWRPAPPIRYAQAAGSRAGGTISGSTRKI